MKCVFCMIYIMYMYHVSTKMYNEYYDRCGTNVHLHFEYMYSTLRKYKQIFREIQMTNWNININNNCSEFLLQINTLY